MKQFRAVFLLECVELAPIAIPGIVAAAIVGANASPPLAALVGASFVLLIGAVVVGVWQSWIDGQYVSNSFRRHRPLPARQFQFARWSAGLTVLALVLLALLASTFVSSLLDFDRSRTLTDVETRAVVSIGASALVQALLVWSVIRFTASIPGRIQAVLWTILLPLAMTTFTIAARGPGHVTQLGVVVLFSVAQGYRLVRPRPGGVM